MVRLLEIELTAQVLVADKAVIANKGSHEKTFALKVVCLQPVTLLKVDSFRSVHLDIFRKFLGNKFQLTGLIHNFAVI